MYVNILRGSSQVGGSIIEIGTDRVKLIFDAGSNLPPLNEKKYRDPIDIPGLTSGHAVYDAVFFTHHHGDHTGLIDRILPEIKIIMSRETHRILDVIADFRKIGRSRVDGHFEMNQPLSVKGIEVTLVPADHSAADASMFLIRADGKTIVYTGDYRRPEKSVAMIKTLLRSGEQIDLLLTEGTNVDPKRNRADFYPNDENDVRTVIRRWMDTYPGTIFVLCSSGNEDRIRAVISAAKDAGRVACEDLFMTSMRNDADEDSVQRFIAFGHKAEESPSVEPYFKRFHDEQMRTFNLIGAEGLAKRPEKHVIFVRPSMLSRFMKKYIKYRGRDGHILIYSEWLGGRESTEMTTFLIGMEKLGIPNRPLHVSGHAKPADIEKLVRELDPETLIPIHCDPLSRGWFAGICRKCLLLKDHETYEV